MAAAVSVMVCGCPFAAKHRAGCWLGEVEDKVTTLISETDVEDSTVVAAVMTLVDLGYLSADFRDHAQVLGLLDNLVELGLLHPQSTKDGGS